MTVYEILKMMCYEKWYIYVGSENITKEEPIKFSELKYEERESVLDALEYQAVKVDLIEMAIYCER